MLFRSAIKRFVATVVALLIGTLLFTLLGHNAVVFGLYLLIFIPVVVRIKVGEGIVPASVLVTHLLVADHITPGLLLNEILLVVVGAGVALLLNLYMPSVEQNLYQIRIAIEKDMYQLFIEMAAALESHALEIQGNELYKRIEAQIKTGNLEAYKHTNNHLFAKETVYERYFAMRWEQFQVMHYMAEHFPRIAMTLKETTEVANFAREVAESIQGRVTSQALLAELENLRQHFKEAPLPTTREAFENRAMLYQFLNDLERFLEIKRSFREGLTVEELEEYIKCYE